MARRRRNHEPTDAVTLTSYADLDAYFEAFAEGNLNLLIVIAPPGLQKTRNLREAAGDRVTWISGHNSALGCTVNSVTPVMQH